jgi:hypothetical protein
MSITRLLVLLILISACVPLGARAQGFSGPLTRCPPEQIQPLPFKNPFLSTASPQQLPARADGLNMADVTPPREFRGVQQHDLIMVDANGALLRVPLRFPCAFDAYPSAHRSKRVPLIRSDGGALRALSTLHIPNNFHPGICY